MTIVWETTIQGMDSGDLGSRCNFSCPRERRGGPKERDPSRGRFVMNTRKKGKRLWGGFPEIRKV